MTSIYVLFLALVMAATPQPVMRGKATYYAEPYIGREMRNGEIYTGQEMTCAVSSDRWDELQGTTLRVCVQPVSIPYKLRCIEVVVTDTGPTEVWQEYGVVVDLSVAAFRALVGPLGIGVAEVEVWRVE